MAVATGIDADGVRCAWMANGNCTRSGHRHASLVAYIGPFEDRQVEQVDKPIGSIMDVKPREVEIHRTRDVTAPVPDALAKILDESAFR